MFGKSEKLIEDIDNLIEEKLKNEFENSFNLYLNQFRKLVDYERELIQKSANKVIEKIDVATNKLINIEEVVDSNKRLSSEVSNLINEIRKRDAIIERKSKQLLKLKETK